MWIVVVYIALFLLAAAALFMGRTLFLRETFTYEKTGEVFKNPLMGFAPCADYIDAVGDNTLVYVDVTWRELEPEQGVYDFEGIREDNLLERWQSEGKNVVFRFVCDVPSNEEHMDIPDWLYELTGDGTFYDTSYGMGYSPDYENETFIEYHEKAVRALGEAFGQDSFFAYIELGSIGHWGEWHVRYDAGIERIPSWEVCMRYVTPYLEAFPNARVLMRRPFEAVSELGLGVYNDMAGDESATMEWLGWIEEGGSYDEAKEPLTLDACPAVWEYAPVGGEFTSGITMEELLVTEQERTLALLEASHMTFLGSMCPIACGEEVTYPAETKKILEKIGYRYGVTKADFSYNKWSEKMKITVELENTGVAPMYFDWPVCLYRLDEDGSVAERFETDFALSAIAQGMKQETTVEFLLPKEELAEDGKIPEFAIAIENPDTGEPAVTLDMEAPQLERYYVLNGD